MTTDELARRLGACLNQEIAAAGRLLDILREEKEALTRGDPAAIEQAGESKQAALGELEARGRDRNEALAAAGCGAEPQAVSALIERCDPKGRAGLADLWQQLLERAAECQQLNTINGAIIQSSFRFTEQALSILHGQPPGTGLEYGPDGNTRHSPGSSSLAKA